MADRENVQAPQQQAPKMLRQSAPAEAARTAAISGATGNKIALDQIDEFRDISEEMQQSPEEQLSFDGRFSRFFSRKVDFDFIDTRISGKNGFQAHGGSTALMKGGLLDLCPAKLTGSIDKKLRSAVGSDASLLLASIGERAVYEVKLQSICLNSEGAVEGKSTKEQLFPLRNNRILSVMGVDVARTPQGVASAPCACRH